MEINLPDLLSISAQAPWNILPIQNFPAPFSYFLSISKGHFLPFSKSVSG